MRDLKVIFADRIFTPTEDIENGAILFEGHRILKVGPREKIKVPEAAAIIDNRGGIIVPGFVDMHIHGAGGRDLMEGTPEAVSAVGSFLARHGTTSYLATTMTAPVDRSLAAIERLANGVNAASRSESGTDKSPAAQPLGIYLEGPFINSKRRGAQPAAHIRKPSPQLAGRMLDAGTGTIKAVALAPELRGALDLVKLFRDRGVRAGLGHSDATYDEAMRAVDAGATHIVHCFNAMRPFGHRDPGIVGAALTERRLSAELIADGVHVDPVAVRLLINAKGFEGVILVTDSVSAAGMPDGEYRLGNFEVQVRAGICRTEDGALAGSTLTLDAAVRNLASFTGAGYQTCLACATLNPARLIGVEKLKGTIAPGADADLAVLDKKFFVTQTYVRGRPVL